MGTEEKSGFLNKRNLGIVGLALLIIVSVAYGVSVYSRHSRGFEPREDRRASTMPQQRSPEEREGRKAQMMDTLDLTPEQREKAEALHEQGAPGSGMFMQMQEILTPEQQGKMREQRESRMKERLQEASKTMRPEDVQALKERMEAKRREMDSKFNPPR